MPKDGGQLSPNDYERAFGVQPTDATYLKFTLSHKAINSLIDRIYNNGWDGFYVEPTHDVICTMNLHYCGAQGELADAPAAQITV